MNMKPSDVDVAVRVFFWLDPPSPWLASKTSRLLTRTRNDLMISAVSRCTSCGDRTGAVWFGDLWGSVH